MSERTTQNQYVLGEVYPPASIKNLN